MKKKTDQTEKKPLIPQKWIPIPIAVIIAALGSLFIVFSKKADILSIVIGAFAIMVATILTTATILGKRGGARFILKLVLAGLLLAAGILALVFMKSSASAVCAAFACAIAADASIKLALSLNSKKYTEASKLTQAVIAVITMLLAFSMVRLTPYEATGNYMRICVIIIGSTAIADAIGTFIIPFLKRELGNAENMTADEYYALGLKTPDEMRHEQEKEKSSDASSLPSSQKADADFNTDTQKAKANDSEKKRTRKSSAPKVHESVNDDKTISDDESKSDATSEDSDVQTLAEPKVFDKPAPAEDVKYDVILTDAGSASMRVIEAIHEATALSLEEAKNRVDSTPSVLMHSVNPEDGRRVILYLMDVGVEAELKKTEKDGEKVAADDAPINGAEESEDCKPEEV